MSINDWKTAVCDTREAYEYHCDISFSQESDASTNLIAALEGLCSAYDVEHTKRLVEDDRLSTQDQWQPIETAPTDGTFILGVYFHKGTPLDYSIIAWSRGDWLGFCDGSKSIRAQGDTFTDYHEPFCTHWMPLPESPKDST
jgi:hypothetical protein